jgi:hypothetical protein
MNHSPKTMTCSFCNLFAKPLARLVLNYRLFNAVLLNTILVVFFSLSGLAYCENSISESSAPKSIQVQPTGSVYIRYNTWGYTRERPKILVVSSNADLRGGHWTVRRQVPTQRIATQRVSTQRVSTQNSSTQVLSGTLGSSDAEAWDQSPFAYNHWLDLSAIQTPGLYFLEISKDSTYTKANGSKNQKGVRNISFEVIQNFKPKRAQLARELLAHLKAMRSQHLGDSSCSVWIPQGEISEGEWTKTSRPKVNMLGGWYDAGDYIKFTQTIAATVYFLSRAGWEAPELFKALPEYKQELLYGMEYLSKTLVDSNTFVIQVGDQNDHRQGIRSPQKDSLNGKRPALTALSPGQMGLTAAALACGAQSLLALDSSVTKIKQFNLYLEIAKRIYRRARQSDVLKENAFERDITNDFYHDPKWQDNMGLAALEIAMAQARHAKLIPQKKVDVLKEKETYSTREYLVQALEYSDAAGMSWWLGWGNYEQILELQILRLVQDYPELQLTDKQAGEVDRAKGRLQAEMKSFYERGRALENIWGVAMSQHWGPVPDYFYMCALALGSARQLKKPEYQELFYNHWDYIWGRNNWSKSFVFQKENPFSVRHIYNQIFFLNQKFPQGAVALGPGSRKIYNEMKKFFKLGADTTNQFNTWAVVFFDHPSDFQTMETVIYGQSTALWALAVESKFNAKALEE